MEMRVVDCFSADCTVVNKSAFSLSEYCPFMDPYTIIVILETTQNTGVWRFNSRKALSRLIKLLSIGI